MNARGRQSLFIVTLLGLMSGVSTAAQTIVSLTFDDGHNDATLAAQMLDQYGFKGTFYIISGVLGSGGYLTVAQLQAIRAAGHEIGSHTISHPPLASLTTAEAEHEICDSRTQLINMGVGPITNIAYPFGDSNSTVEAIARTCYESGRGAWQLGCDYDGCANAESIPPVNPYWIRTPASVVDTMTLDELKQQVTIAEDSGGGWVPLKFHHVCASGCGQYTITPANLDSFLSWLQARAGNGTVVKTVSEVISSVSNNPIPGLSQITPNSATAGSSAFTLTLTGTHFIENSIVQWNGSPRSTTYINSTTLTAVIPASDVANAGAASVTVLNPVPGGGTSSGQITFSITEDPSLYTLFGANQPAPSNSSTDRTNYTLGVRWTSDVNGTVTGLRYYRWPGNTGTHVGNLWTNTGTKLAEATFTGGTASGWQTVIFAAPVAITAGTTYVASYWTNTGFAVTTNFFTTALNNPPLHAPASVTGSLNGLYRVSATPAFPTSSTSKSNYWVDVIFTVSDSTAPTQNPVPSLTDIQPSSATAGGAAFTLAVNGSNFISGSSVHWNGAPRPTTFVNGNQISASIDASDITSSGTANVTVFTPAPGGGTSATQIFTIAAPPIEPNPIPDLTGISPNQATAGDGPFAMTLTGSNFLSNSTVRWNGAPRTTTFITNTTLTAAISAADIASAGTADVTVFNSAPGGGTSSAQTFTINASTTPAGGPWTIWGSSGPKIGEGWKDPTALEVGVRFRSDVAGYITGLRFYKWSTNTGTHTGHLWTNNGTLLAQATFTGETTSGWQTVYFASPVAISANTTYVASYHTTTGYAVTNHYFITGVNNAPLRALASGVDGLNGLYRYNPTSIFPTQSTRSSNYWVDVVLNTTPNPPAESLSSLPPSVGGGAGTVYTDFSQAREYPNPWRANLHNGRNITFDQLPLDSTVKIFTLSAHWVVTLAAPAGSVQWNLTTSDGEAVASGYYIYLITSPSTGKTRGTLAIIR